MASDLTRRRRALRESLTKVLNTIPEASLLSKRYNALRFALLPFYPHLLENREVSLGFLKEIVFLDRIIRLETVGMDKENKTIAEQKFEIEELGAEIGLKNNINIVNKNYNDE